MTTYPQIDYTSRDFASLVQDMTALIDTRVPDWTDRSVNDFGMVLVEMFAYMGDILGYYGDRIANESYLATATQRESVLALARLLDYIPSGPVAASVGLTFNNPTASFVWILKGTQVSTTSKAIPAPDPSKPFLSYLLPATGPVYFETVADVLVPPNGSASVTAVEGVTYNELTGTSNGTSDQDFPLFRSPVIGHSVTVMVNTTKWVYYERLVDAYPTTRAYTLETDGDGIVHVVFGDNANGAIPPLGGAIDVTYRVGGGKRGNVPVNTITRIISTVPAGIKVTNPPVTAAPGSGGGVGGGDAETIDQIKANAPRSLFALQRAVTLDDFVGLALRVGGVAKASAPPPATCSSVTLYIAPTGGGGLDTSGNPTAAFNALKARVANYLADKVPIGTTVVVADPTYVPVSLTVNLVVQPKYRQLDVRNAVQRVTLALFAFDNTVFGDTITLKDLHTALATVPGLKSVTISQMVRDIPNGVTIDTLDTALTGTGWTVNNVYQTEGTGCNAHTGPGTGSRTFPPKDLSAYTQLQLRGSYTGNNTAYLATTLTLTDINGNTWALGTRTHGSPIGFGAGTWTVARWDPNWPADADLFDCTQVTGYTQTTVPKNVSGNVFYLDNFTAYVAETEDLHFAPNEIPLQMVLGHESQSSLSITYTGGLP